MLDVILAQTHEGVKNPNLWYPTILGILVVLSAIGLFCGSVYLLLATNLGARLGFLVAIGALSGFMVLLSSLWLTTTSPLNTLKGRIPAWKPVEAIPSGNLARSTISDARSVRKKGHTVDPTEATNVKAAVDQAVVKPTPGPPGEPAPVPSKFAVYDQTTDYLVTQTYEVGGGGRVKVTSKRSFPWVTVSLHKPKYAVVTICPVDKAALQVPFGDPIPPPRCDLTKPVSNLVLERDLGSLRVPPFMALLGSSLVFGLVLLCLYWREKDLQALQQAPRPAGGELPAPAATPDRTPAPV